MPFHDILLAIAFVVLAYAVALPTWFVRHKAPTVRTILLVAQMATLFALPWLYPAKPVAFKALVALSCCGASPPKLLDMYIHPAHWLARPMREWLAYLLNPFIIVHRLHINRLQERPAPAPNGGRRLLPRVERSGTRGYPALQDSRPGAGGGKKHRGPLVQFLNGTASLDPAAGRRLALRGILEMALGGLILWLAFQIDFRGPRWSASFCLEHAIKLLAAYLLVFDGLFVLATGVIRMLGQPVLDLTQNPAAAATPADFWRRYNCEAGRFLREDVFYPLGGRRHPATIAVVTFLINGLLHEYLTLIMVGRITGYQMLFFTLHGLATALTLRLRPRGPARILTTAATVLFLYFTSILFFATVDLFVPWYSHHTPR